MASTSSSSVQKSFKYDVFLSFRGEDTRNNFVSHLYKALVDDSVKTYKDDETIEKGERINNQLIESIKDSKLHIIVFSKNYADSSWCLDELVQIMECQNTTEQTAYPVFYKVETTQVRKQTGPVKDAFAKHEKKEDAGKWREALTAAAGLAGWEFKETSDGITEAQFIQNIVVEISLKLDSIHSSIDEKLVGMETRVNEMVSFLEIGSNDVQIIGIKGMGGSGKTTLASAVYNHISAQFEVRSFVENVGEISKESSSGLKKLQKKVLQDVSNYKEYIKVTSVDDGKYKLKRRMSGRKILIVLDGVDNIEQLEALAGSRDWFKPGSRIIVTTRDEQVLDAYEADYIHDVKLLVKKDAICLFSRCTIKTEISNEVYEEVSNKVVKYADGLPLTIKALGSHLCKKSESVWKDAIERLKKIPVKETSEKLKISYDGLEDDEKEIFLDVACILKGETKDEAIRVLKSCGLHPAYGLSVLQKKSLITISSDGHLGLHKHMEEMGRNIVRQPNEPQKHSRLWIQEEIKTIFTNDSGTEAIRSIKLAETYLSPATIKEFLENRNLSPDNIMNALENRNLTQDIIMRHLQKTYISPDIIMKGLEKMKNLRFIHVDNGFVYNNVYPSNASLPDALRYIYWPNYPFCCLPITFLADNPQMAGCKINHTREENKRKVHTNLRCVHLKSSHLKTFDLGATEKLETLDLRKCKNIVELHMTITLEYLKILDLHGSNVSKLNLSLTPYLEKLSLSLKGDRHLPENICTLKDLKCLKLTYCWALEQLPKDIQKLENLEVLHLTYCSELKVVPYSICKMKRLRSIHLPSIGAQILPDELGELKDLEELNLEGACITQLPDSILKKKGLCIVGSKGLLMRNGFKSFTEITDYTGYCII